MSGLYFFGFLLLLLPSKGAGWALLLIALASAVLSASLAFGLRSRLPAPARTSIDKIAGLLGLPVLALLALGLRLESSAYTGDTGLQLLDILLPTAVSLAGAAIAGTLATAITGLHHLPLARDSKKLTATCAHSAQLQLAASKRSLHALLQAVAELEEVEHRAQLGAQKNADRATAKSYLGAAESIAEKVAAAKQLAELAQQGFLRLFCRTVLQLALTNRPDSAIALVGRHGNSGTPTEAQVKDAIDAVVGYLQTLQSAESAIQDEANGAPGSVAFEFSCRAQEAAAPVAQALQELQTSYNRTRHQLQAIRLKIQAQSKAQQAVAAATRLAQNNPGENQQPQTEALVREMANTEAALDRAQAFAIDHGDQLNAAVQRATDLIQSEQDSHLGDALASMREVTQLLK